MKLILNKLLYTNKSPIHGFGVFTEGSIKKNEVIEECHIFHLNDDMAYELIDYRFSFPKGGSGIVMPAGFGAIYNHNNEPNIGWKTDEERNLIIFYTLRDIESGEELCHNYGKHYWDSRKGYLNEK